MKERQIALNDLEVVGCSVEEESCNLFDGYNIWEKKTFYYSAAVGDLIKITTLPQIRRL